MQILVVEDDVRLAQALCRILEESGYKTDAVHDGQSGLDYAESGIYDVVILDVMLPKMDGFTVVSNLRRTCAHSRAAKARYSSRRSRRGTFH